MPRSSTTGKGGTGPLSRTDGKTYCLDTGNTNAIEIRKDNLVMQINPSKESGGVQPYKHNRIYDINGISPCLNTDTRSPAIEVKSGKGATIPGRAREDGSGQNVVSVQGNIRRLTPIECERLQTVFDNKTKYGIDHKGNKIEISDSQRYKMLGNGFTIEVISHILSYLPKEYFNNK